MVQKAGTRGAHVKMSKHDSVTKRHRRPRSGKRVDYTARTMAAVKQLQQAAQLEEAAILRPKPASKRLTPASVPTEQVQASNPSCLSPPRLRMTNKMVSDL